MKNKVFTFFLMMCVAHSFAQNNLHALMQGANGVSNAFVTLNASHQIPFATSQAKTIFGLDQNSDLVLIRAENDQIGMVHYRYYQTYKGIPVENTMYIAHTKNAVLTGMSGTIITDFTSQEKSQMSAEINGDQAIASALQFVHAQKYIWQDSQIEQRIKTQTGNSKATYYPIPTKVWYNINDELNASTLQLAYKIDVYSLQPLDRSFYFVDARTGKVIGQKEQIFYSDAVGTAATAYSGTQTIHSDLNGSTYRLRDLTKGDGVVTLNENGVDYTSTSQNWSFTNNNKYALDAHWGVSETYAFYLANYDRNSVDDAGAVLTSYVNESFTVDNAYWDGVSMHFGVRSTDGSGVTAIDVTGHELTHGVTQNESNLIYNKESGAINESMSDIFGKSVQFWAKPTDVNWLLSNDMNWAIRDMSNPNAYQQPDTYHGHFWYNGALDNGGVHTNSGVGNFMFYLLVNGGAGTNDIGNAYSVSGIGLTEADNILYRTNTVYLVPSSKYVNWRDAAINAATDLYGASSNEVIQVENAFYAVGIGTAGGGGCTDNFEPNDTRKTAAPLSVNTNNTGLISSSTDLDWYIFSNTASQPNIQINLTNLPADYDVFLSDATLKHKIGSSKNRGTANEQINYNTSVVGNYNIRVVGYLGAFDATNCYTINASISSTPFKLSQDPLTLSVINDKSISLYPNPNDGNMMVVYTAANESDVQLNVYDVTGRIVFTQNNHAAEGVNHFNINESNFSNGVYFMEVKSNGVSERSKFMIQK